MRFLYEYNKNVMYNKKTNVKRGILEEFHQYIKVPWDIFIDLLGGIT